MGAVKLQNTVPAFTLEQVQWLNRAFPENTNINATADELFSSQGSRRVVKRIESLYYERIRQNSK
jgi:hypothetical protein